MQKASDFDLLLHRISDRSAVIGIIGMGYVGQPLALRFSEVGFRVLGFDMDQDRVAQLNSGVSSIEHIEDARLQNAIENGFEATCDPARVAEVDAVIICVPTPLNKYREPDLSFVTRSCEDIAPHIKAGTLVSLESTTYPGTTDEEIAPRLEREGLRIGETVFVVYSPEREDPGNETFGTANIPKLIGGMTPQCLQAGTALYEAAIDRVVPLSSTRAAEMTKLLENIHRAVNIGLINEMKIVADLMGIDIFEVVDAAATKPFGFTPYYPGPGLGGHCIPIDPFYLTWKAREFGVHTRFVELAGEINRAMPEYVFGKLRDGLNARGKPVKGSNILVLGLAYKKNIDDVRESPSIHLMELIRSAGANLNYSDPHVPHFPQMREHRFDLASQPVSETVLTAQDAVIITTDHSVFDYELIARHAPLIIDSRGVYRDPADHILRA